jgi:threonine dehydrogenase-like Zn-dependent dehydrogenase
MKAVTCNSGNLEVAEVADPRPGMGQVLLNVVRCGICGSDLHARRHADEQADVIAEAGYDGMMRGGDTVVMGHEFCGEVAEYGPECRAKLPAGTPVVALPLIRHGSDIHPIGLSQAAPGAYAEQVIVEEALMLPVPNGLRPEVAVLTEPLAIGWHAVRRAEVKKKDVAVVIGCGPVGLAVVCMLKARGVGTVIASDLSPGRRALAKVCGADIVVDPRQESPYGQLDGRGFITTIPALATLGLETMERLRGGPVPWQHVWRTVEALGVGPKSPVIFECVGVPGMIDGIIAGAPLSSRVVVAGVCMTPDTIRPAMAINKQVDLRFVVGYSPLEFRDTLHMLADGKLNAAPMVTGTVDLDGVAKAFDELGDPEAHAKILIDPRMPQPA